MNLDDINDVHLMNRVAAGDATALEALYDRYSSAVMGLAWRMLLDRAAADEVVQETFWRVWKKANSFKTDRGSVRSWLFAIAHNACIDELRRIKADPVLIDERQFELRGDGAPGVASQVASGIERKQILAALEELPSEQKEVIELSFFGGLSRQEIAKKIGIPLGTVHTRARLGLQKLRSTLSAMDFEHE
jgi:RNA polymerase sigma-70 factor (ECF subfamily)